MYFIFDKDIHYLQFTIILKEEDMPMV